MSEIDKGRRLEIINQLRATECVCGSSKRRMQSHCSSCYFKLPKELRGQLYRRFGAGYEEAYEASLRHLSAAKEGRSDA